MQPIKLIRTRIGVNLLLSLLLGLSMATAGLADQDSEGDYFVYLPGLSRNYTYQESTGTLDPKFGGNGLVITDFGSNNRAYGVAVQPDWKIVAGGWVNSPDPTGTNFALARYNRDGGLDLTLDSDGMVSTNVSGSSDYGRNLLLQPDGKIIVAGETFTGAAFENGLVRYNSDGSLDASFGGDGMVVTAVPKDVGGIIIQPDGKIIVVGAGEGSIYNDFALARYNPDGSLDTGFDGDGSLMIDFGNNESGTAVALQPDGKIIAAGYANTSTRSDFAVVRLNPDGSLDTSFEIDGKVTYDIGGGDDWALDVVIQADGKIVAVGRNFNSTTQDSDAALVRLMPNGTLDTSFGSGGIVITEFGRDDYFAAVTLQPNGKIIGVGYQYGDISDFLLARYNPNGSLDTSFSNDGLLTIDFYGFYDAAFGVALQTDGAIVVAGYANNGTYDNFALARLK